MKRNKAVLYLEVIMCVACIFALSPVVAFAQQAGGGCRIARIEGKVETQGAGGGEWRPAKAGEALAEGARVRTGAKSEAYLSFNGGASVKVAAMSMLKVSLRGDGGKAGGGLRVSEGKVFARVSKLDKDSSFSVKTPSAVAGVRGTQFSVGVKAGGGSGPGATVTGLKGKVEVKRGGTAAWVEAKDGTKVFRGDSVRSGAGGSCALAWGKGNVLAVKPLSQLTVNELAGGAGAAGDNDVTLSTGKAVINAKKVAGGGSSFSVRTPTAVAGVRGTKFDVSVSGGDPARVAAVSGKLLEVRGSVEVLPRGNSSWKKATENMVVKAGDSVRTRAGSSCVVAWGKGNAARVSAMTAMKLELLNTAPAAGGDDSALSVTTGKIFVKAKKSSGAASSFTVKTPTAVAGVRGTKFSVGVNGKGGAGASLAAVTGSVEVSADGGASWTAGAKGSVLREGDAVRTGKGGGCVLAWGKGNVVKVRELSRMTIDLLRKDADGEKSGLKLDKGGVQFKAKKMSGAGSSFMVRTPTAVAGVRGTRCAVEALEDESTVARCLDGELEVGGLTGETVSVGAGEKSGVKEGGAPSAPVKMSDAEIGDMKSDSELDDPAFDSVDVSEGAGLEKVNTAVACAEGEVAVSANGGAEVSVKEGEKTEVAAGSGPTAPAEMSQEEIKGFNKEAGLDNPAFGSAGAEGYEADKPGATEVRCAEGEVEVAAAAGGEAVSVGAGEKSSVDAGGEPTAAAAMTQDEMNEIKSESALDDPMNLEMSSAPGDGDAGETAVACVEGELAIASADGGEIELGAGMRIGVDGDGGAEAPAAMSAEELGAFEAEAAGLESIEAGALDPGGSGSAGGDADAAGALDSIDAAIDNTVITDTVDSAAPDETFDIEVDLIFQ